MAEKKRWDVYLTDFEGNMLLPRAYKDNMGLEIHKHLVDVDDTNAAYNFHIKSTERTKWNSYGGDITDITNELNSHVNNTDVHTTATQKDNWDKHIHGVEGLEGDTEHLHLTDEDKDKMENFADKVHPLNSVFFTTDNDFDPNDDEDFSPIPDGATQSNVEWTQLPNLTLGTGSSAKTVYAWERTR